MTLFFDAHVHPSLKKQFAKPEPSTSNPWGTLKQADFLNGIHACKCLLRPFVESTLSSQASLRQLTDSGYKMAIVVLFHPDKGLLELILNNPTFRKIVEKGKFGDIITQTQLTQLINTTDAFATVKRDLELLKMKENADEISILTSDQFQPGDFPVVVFSVEGLHCLRSRLAETDPTLILADIEENLDFLRKGKYPLVSVNIAHIDNGNGIFANQAYAADGFRESHFREENLRPTGNGLTELGKRAVRMLYERGHLPDVKHMSWLARKEFYAFRQSEAIPEPIVCSHAGFTGCWFNKHNERLSNYVLQRVSQHGQYRLVLAKPNPYFGTDTNRPQEIGFNASTINLFNEDIEAIFHSNGLIGLSLDQRVLGYTDILVQDHEHTDNIMELEFPRLKLITDSDFISDQEFQREPIFQQGQPDGHRLLSCVDWEVRKDPMDEDMRTFYHPRHFYLHVLHAIKLGEQFDGEAGVIKMLTRILCIGSDFDGLIDGLNCCANVTEMNSFRKKFIKDFPDFLKEVDASLPDTLSIEQVADRIFYENGRDFVLQRIRKLQELQVLV